MKKLTSFQKAKCLKIINKLISWPICAPFIELVDVDRDGAPDYYDYIKEPMSLAEVKRKLNANKYESIKAWKRDVNLIWSNTKTYNGDDALFTHMAMEASLWFNEKTENFPLTKEEEWTGKFQKVAKKLLNVLTHPPAGLDLRGKITEIDNSDDTSQSTDDK